MGVSSALKELSLGHRKAKKSFREVILDYVYKKVLKLKIQSIDNTPPVSPTDLTVSHCAQSVDVNLCKPLTNNGAEHAACGYNNECLYWCRL